MERGAAERDDPIKIDRQLGRKVRKWCDRTSEPQAIFESFLNCEPGESFPDVNCRLAKRITRSPRRRGR